MFLSETAALSEDLVHKEQRGAGPTPTQTVTWKGLVACCSLLNATYGALVAARAERMDIDAELGKRDRRDAASDVLKHVLGSGVLRGDAKYPLVTTQGNVLVVTLEEPGVDAQYFVFWGEQIFPPETRHLLSELAAIVAAEIRTVRSLHLLADQRRIFARRTVLGQVRPNELLYLLLKRLKVHIPWNRCGTILLPAATVAYDGQGMEAADHWVVAAEQVHGGTDVSHRIGRRVDLRPGEQAGAAAMAPILVPDLAVDGFDQDAMLRTLVRQVVNDRTGLPPGILQPRSMLIHPFTYRVGEGGRGVGGLLLLTDSRPARFVKSHLASAAALTADVGEILQRSFDFSQKLLGLSMPHLSPNANDFDRAREPRRGTHEDPVQVEALGDEVFGGDRLLKVLSMDALQVVQLPRRTSRQDALGRSLVTAVRYIQAKWRPGDRAPATLSQGTQLWLQLHSKADLLRAVVFEGKEIPHKSPGGLDPDRLAQLLLHGPDQDPYQSVLIQPITSRGQVTGALLAYRRALSEFGDYERLLMRSVSMRIGERIDLQRRLADRVRLLKCLSAVAQSPSAAAAKEALVQGARDILDADHAFLMVAKEPTALASSRRSVVLAEDGHSWGDEDLRVPEIILDGSSRGITGAAYTTKKPQVIRDVSKFRPYVAFVRSDGSTVEAASELAIPIMSLSTATKKQRVLGVLDAVWLMRQEISTYQLHEAIALSRHAAAILQMATGYAETVRTREKLNLLVSLGSDLQSLEDEESILEWLAKAASKLVDCDLAVVLQHERESESLEILHRSGPGAAELKGHKTLGTEGWLGGRIAAYRDSGVRTWFQRHDSPSRRRKLIPKTKAHEHQSDLLACLDRSSSDGFSSERSPETVWAVWLTRTRASNFNEQDRTLLSIVVEDCQAALQRLNLQSEQKRDLKLAQITRDVALDVINHAHRDPNKILGRVQELLRQELNALAVRIIGFDPAAEKYYNAQEVPAGDKREATFQLPRPDGVTEAIRKLGKDWRHIVVPDIRSPPPALVEPIASSSFHSTRPVRAFIALPLYSTYEDAAGRRDTYNGVIYVNFATVRRVTPGELDFAVSLAKFATECLGIEHTVLQMRQETFAKLRSVGDPAVVFRKALRIAVDGIRRILPVDRERTRTYRVGGTLQMLTAGTVWPRLVLRATIGKRSGDYTGVQGLGEGVIGRVATTGKAIMLDDTGSPDAKEMGYRAYLKGMRSEMAVPILLDGAQRVDGVAKGVVGVLNIECSIPGAFTAQHAAILRLFLKAPISAVLHLAERHELQVSEVRKNDDEFVVHAARILLHDLSRPMRELGRRIGTIRAALSHPISRSTRTLLKDMESEGKQWEKLNATGLVYLGGEVLQSRRPCDAISLITKWREACGVPIALSGPPARVKDFYINRGHDALIHMILNNLLANSESALRDTPKRQRRISIHMSVTRADSPELEYLDVHFSDNGRGFDKPPELWPALFRPFSFARTNERPRPGSGWGLGLPMIAQMMHLMSGEVEIVGSQPRRKTTLRLRFVGQSGEGGRG